MEIDLERLRELMQAMGEFDVTRVELEDEEERLVLERGHVAPAAAVSAPSATPNPPPAQDAASEDEGDFITSPFVGTFYSAPSPELPAFVSAGAEVTPGQTLCIVEAMKLMNEIEAEQACQILEVLIENGQPVEFGARLFRIAPR
ncbi:MAG: acetyl-CoA carboxylase biotin carboxyl carrier protein [Deltaproteobacteria bacterium]|nr:acetyl-CoA carboxylase biotin carboxyl carrier protein [Deltaproteobacteria bacterium]